MTSHSKWLKDHWFNLLLVTLTCYGAFFYGLGSYTLLDVDEPRYAEAAREMIESGNWITPYFNYDPRFAKPVLFYWFIAISYIVFGITEFAARLPSALMAYFTVLLTYMVCEKSISKKFALISAVILATSIEFVGLARMSITDMTLSFFISSSLICAFLAYSSTEKERKIWWILSYLSIGLSILTKGPIGLVLPGLILLVFLLFVGELKATIKSAYIPWGIFIILLVAVPWYVLVILDNGQAYIDQFFLTDNFQRFTNTVSGHKGPIYFYFIVILVGIIPWVTYLPSGIYCSLKPVLELHKAKDESFFKAFKIYFRELPKKNHLIFYCFLWFIITFIFFTVAGTKLLTYVLPLFPALAILIGYYLYECIEFRGNIKVFMIETALFFAFTFVASYLISFHFSELMPREAKAIDLEEAKHFIVSILFCGGIFSLMFTLKHHFYKAFFSIVTMSVILIGFSIDQVMPKVNNAAQGALNDYISLANTYHGKNNPIIMFGIFKPSIVFYAHRKIYHYEPEDVNKLVPLLNHDNVVFIITRVKYIDLLTSRGFLVVDQSTRFALVTNKKIDQNQQR